MNLTPEQSAIIAAARDTSSNLIIKALAGTGKTSTLVELARALPDTSMLCLAFNKATAEEMVKRLPPNCTSKTINGLGHGIWADATGRRLILQANKNFGLLKETIETLSQTEKGEAYKEFAETLNAIAFGKSCGYVPTGHFPNAKRLMDDEAFFAHLPEKPSRLQERLIATVSVESIKQALTGKIDFDDQVLMPTIFSAPFPSFPLVLIDEAQDLSALNHAFLRKLVKKRIIAVGDECQAIYGFRGAHQDSMHLLEETFSMTPLILSTCFRCPQRVIEEARWRAPHMNWLDDAPLGSVETLEEYDVTMLPEKAAIICRNNAPLFNFAIHLLKNKRNPRIVGNDIGAGLLKIMRKFGSPSINRADAEDLLNKWLIGKLAVSRYKKKIEDQADCIRVFLAQGDTLGDAIAYAEFIFAQKGPIQLMTGHKAKGLEFDDVFILDKQLIDVGEGQEDNLLYVMQTRAKQRLTYITSPRKQASMVDPTGA